MEVPHDLSNGLSSTPEIQQEVKDNHRSSNLSIEAKHGKWSNKVDFVFACAASGIGLGNVWRFPYLCYINGGGAFLVPYLIFAFSTGLPMAFLEVAVGQYTSYGGVKAWQICPLLQGIGYASIMMLFLGNMYYNVILSWTLHYLFSSFTSILPWNSCNNKWNTIACFPGNETGTFNSTGLMQHEDGLNSTGSLVKTDPVTEYWENRVLGLSSGIHEMGTVRWDLSLCLLLIYVIVNICIWKGLKNSRILLYFIVCTPFILLTILLVKGITLPGSVNGIKYYMIPDWGRLADSRVWTDAGTQVFYSYNVGSGVLINLGSYNKFHHNFLRDASIYITINIFTSLFSGFVIFSVLGFMAHNLGVSIADVAESGPGLSFVVYPKALAKMPLAPFWSILFFTTIIFLGLSTMLGNTETLVSSVVDLLFRFCRKSWLPSIVLVANCFICFLIGLTMVTNGGIYLFQLFDFFVSARFGVLIGCLECIVIVHLYGLDKFNNNIKNMLGHGLNFYVKLCWRFLTPVATFVIFILGLYNYTEVVYNKNYSYPNWSVCIGWLLASASMTIIPAIAIARMMKIPGKISERLRKLIQPIGEDINNYTEVPKEIPTDKETEKL